MGSFSLSFYKKVIFFLILGIATSLHAKKFEGVDLKDSFKCGEKSLPLKAASLRTFTWLRIRVYVVALYSEHLFTGLDDPKLNQRPTCFELTYLRDVDNDDTDKAWEAQFNDSSMFPYKDLPKHIQYLKDKYGAIEGERKHVFALLPNGITELWENGSKKGEIKSEEFQKNFFSIWYGKNPPTDKVKNDLLSGFSQP